MSRWNQVLQRSCLVVLAAAVLGACTAPEAPNTGPRPTASVQPPVAATTASPIVMPSMPSDTPTLAASPKTTAPGVIVTASKGNVYIRRGPDPGFNPIGALLAGQSAAGLARDVLSEWIKIPIPGQSSQTGWVSVQTPFTTISGDFSALPEEQPDFWPVGATIRNCTLHQMLITPGNIILPSVQNFPANDVRVNPGVYVVVDTDVDGYPQVLKAEIREGSAVDVRVDGNGEKKKCAVP